MSPIDPDTRWWRWNSTRRAAAYLCIALGIVASFIGSRGMSGMTAEPAGWISEGVAIACFCAAIPLLVGGSLIHAFGVGGDARQPRMVVWSLPLCFIASGVGGLLAAHETFGEINLWGHVIFAVFILGGIVAIIVIEALRRHSQSASMVRGRVERSGVATRGTVTRAKSYSMNDQLVTRVTVRFTDRDNRTRWRTTQTIPGNVSKGAQVKIRYSPDDVDHKAGIIVGRSCPGWE